jgi:hypothetical protein
MLCNRLRNVYILVHYLISLKLCFPFNCSWLSWCVCLIQRRQQQLGRHVATIPSPNCRSAVTVLTNGIPSTCLLEVCLNFIAFSDRSQKLFGISTLLNTSNAHSASRCWRQSLLFDERHLKFQHTLVWHSELNITWHS